MRALIALFLLMCWLASGAAHAATQAPCLPKLQWPPQVAYGVVPSTVSQRYEGYAAWVCQQPTGYATTAWLFSASEVSDDVLRYMAGLFSKTDADAKCASACVDPTAAELGFLTQLLATNMPRALAAFNGASVTRSVYASNPDGTLNPTPIAGSLVAVAAACNPAKRIPGTPYYSVSGVTDAAQPGKALGDVYAICVVSLPIGSN